MGSNSAGKEGEPNIEYKPFLLEWVINEGPNRIALLSVRNQFPGGNFKNSIVPGIKEIIAQGNKILSIAPAFVAPGPLGGEVLDFVVVTQPSRTE